jgi:predicted metallo-beta-lactamase superfamily hydrolase
MYNQLLLFQDDNDSIQDRKILILEEKYEKIRKSQHARISMLQKEINDLKAEMEFLKFKICKEGLFL